MVVMEKESKMYEVGYLISPLVPVDKIADEALALRKVIEDKQGLLISEGEAKMQKLAYTIEKDGVGKFDDAYFGWIRFFADSGVLADIKKSFEDIKDVLRFLIVKLDKEAPKKISKKPAKKIHDIKVEEKSEVQEEEVDKRLEEILGGSEDTTKDTIVSLDEEVKEPHSDK